MIPPITTGTGTTTTAQSKQVVGKDDFLKLLVAQLEHQDPLKPQDDTAFVAQLAQFAQLEQSQQQTSLLQGLGTMLSGQSGTQATGLLGQTVTAQLGAISLRQDQAPGPLNFVLDKDAQSVKLIIRDSGGAAVRTLEAGALKSGTQQLVWDGKGDVGQVMPEGSYRYEVVALREDGSPAGVRMEQTGLVKSIAYDRGVPELVLADGTRVQLADVTKVSK